MKSLFLGLTAGTLALGGATYLMLARPAVIESVPPTAAAPTDEPTADEPACKCCQPSNRTPVTDVTDLASGYAEPPAGATAFVSFDEPPLAKRPAGAVERVNFEVPKPTSEVLPMPREVK